MSDADLIYNACLRAERRLEKEIIANLGDQGRAAFLRLPLMAIQTLREEIGNGLSRESR